MEFLAADIDLTPEEKSSFCRQKIIEAQIMGESGLESDFNSTVDEYAEANKTSLAEMDEILLKLQQKRLDTTGYDEIWSIKPDDNPKNPISEVEEFVRKDTQNEESRAQNLQNLIDSAPAHQPMRDMTETNAKLANSRHRKSDNQAEDSILSERRKELTKYQDDKSCDEHPETTSQTSSQSGRYLRESDSDSDGEEHVDLLEAEFQRIHLEVMAANSIKSFGQEEEVIRSGLDLQEKVDVLSDSLRQFESDLDRLLGKK